MKILANDGIAKSGIDALETAGFEVITDKVAQENLIDFINENNVSGIIVRSATKVRKDIIDACTNLKLIGRGGVGMDNIDVDYAREKGLHVINTPAASSRDVTQPSNTKYKPFSQMGFHYRSYCSFHQQLIHGVFKSKDVQILHGL